MQVATCVSWVSKDWSTIAMYLQLNREKISTQFCELIIGIVYQLIFIVSQTAVPLR